MNKAFLFVAAALASFLVGCGTPGQAYAKQHPELSPEHRQIFMTGKIPDGTAVAGLTRDQVQVVMGSNVTQYTKLDGHDAWVYVKRKLSSEPLTSTNADLSQHEGRNRNGMEDSGTHAPDSQPQVRTTIVFDGDIATRADVTNGGL